MTPTFLPLALALLLATQAGGQETPSCPRELGTPDANMRANMRLHVLRQAEPASITEVADCEWPQDELDAWIEGGHFKVERPTLMYTHGWMQNGSDFWLQGVRADYDQLFANVDAGAFNLLIFDWGAYSDPKSFPTSVSYVPHLGGLVANLFEQLRDRHQYDMNLVHLVTFSLSTHIGGVAGRRLSSGGSPVGQITALDPTGVCFHEMPGGGNGEDLTFGGEHGLRADDAQLVVARHYNMYGLGARRLIGGLDIFVNCGKKQPEMEQSFPSDSPHFRAGYHEADGAALEQSECQQMAYACSDRDSYLAGKCADCGEGDESCYMITTLPRIQARESARPGDTKAATPISMYVDTGRQHFCLFTYQVLATLKFDAPPEAAQSMRAGELKLTLPGGLQVNPRNQWTERRFTQLLELDEKLPKFERQLEFQAGDNFHLEWLERVEINYMSHSSAQVRASSSVAYCPSGDSLQQCE